MKVKKRRYNKSAHLLIFLLLTSLFLGCVGQTKISSTGVKYDAGIPWRFLTKSEVRVLVKLVDNSNITSGETREERHADTVRKYEWSQPVIDVVLAAIPPSEISDVSEGYAGFGATVSKGGFLILINNSLVESVTFVDTPPPALSDS